MDKNKIPFNAGQFVESRSFLQGYRGAWFRCKIRGIYRRKSGLGIDLEYSDFPDEKVRWTKLYQKSPSSGGKLDAKRKLMARPHFPTVYQESLIPDISTIAEVVVIVNDDWKVGDLVDWFSDGCFWSGRITEILGFEKFQLELLPPPYGEGLSYEVSSKDLRPSLEWSPEHGWTVPLPLGKEPRHYCARLIRPASEDGANLMVDVAGGVKRDGKEAARASLEKSVSQSSYASESSLPAHKSRLSRKRFLSDNLTREQSMPGMTSKFYKADNDLERASCSDNISTSRIGDVCAETAGTSTKKDSSDLKVDGGISISSMPCETMEDAISGLEELVNRVKWIKGLLQSRMLSSNNVSWKFVEHRA